MTLWVYLAATVRRGGGVVTPRSLNSAARIILVSAAISSVAYQRIAGYR
jgi:hypothetical protein